MEDILSLDFDGIVSDEVEKVRLETIRPSEKNAGIYDPPSEGLLKRMANDIKRDGGLIHNLIVSLDDVIISGHTRYKALQVAGRKFVKIQRASVYEDDPRFLELLLSANRGRIKTEQERTKEITASIDPKVYIRQMKAQKLLGEDGSDVTLEGVQGSLKVSRNLTSNYDDLVGAVKDVLERMEDYRPLTLRHIHYELLNTAPLVSKKTGRNYSNIRDDYNILSRVVTKMRVNGVIPFAWITDNERDFKHNRGFANVDHYLEFELKRIFDRYKRDLFSTQERYIAIVFEKWTIQSILDNVMIEYPMPVLYCKGGSGIDPRYVLMSDWHRNGRKPITLLFLSDLDPAGYRIQDTFAGSLEKDFHKNPHTPYSLSDADLDNMKNYRIGITPDQVEKHSLVTSVEVKDTDPEYKSYIERFNLKGGEAKAYELESMPPEILESEIRRAIEQVFDREAYDQQYQQYEDDLVPLIYKREIVFDALGSS